MEILEPKLGDVVSGDLCCLVNKLCEAAPSSYYAVKSCPPTNDRFWRRKVDTRIATSLVVLGL